MPSLGDSKWFLLPRLIVLVCGGFWVIVFCGSETTGGGSASSLIGVPGGSSLVVAAITSSEIETRLPDFDLVCKLENLTTLHGRFRLSVMVVTVVPEASMGTVLVADLLV